MSKIVGKIITKAYMVLTATKFRKVVRGIDAFLQRHLGKVYDATLGKLKYKLRYDVMVKNTIVSEESFSNICWMYEEEILSEYAPLVSVIVPNYNHAMYLEERLEAIYNQTYKNIEVILLDDSSTDNSREILDRYAEVHSENTIKVYNETNCGRIFQQWNRGIELSKGELIWIAESDDFCELNFLEEIVKTFRYDSVRLAFARSVFVQNGKKIWSTEEYLSDLERMRWDKPFYMTSHNMVRFGFAIHNIIPNVSSAVFRNVGKTPSDVVDLCSSMKLSGDWIFYLSMIQGGVVAYTNATTNYYRIHEQSTSLKVQEEEQYYKEFQEVSKYVYRNYAIAEDTLQTILSNLKEHYLAHHPEAEDADVVDTLYSLDEIIKEKEKRRPQIALACYALRSGGGETYPIYLANEMKKQGYPVTLINFNVEEQEKRIRDLIDKQVPLVTVSNRNYIYHVISQLGIEIIHSHQASIDELIANWLIAHPTMCQQVISLHGMYECIAPEDCKRVVQKTNQTCKQYIYIADKNLGPFKEAQIELDDRFVKFPNGVPKVDLKPIERESLGIPQDAFVFVLASRGLPEKGWREATQSIKEVNIRSERPVHLVILGDGPVAQEVKKEADNHIHLVGTVSNVSDYFAMGDMGLLPTYFEGESYPLTVAECLSAGKPVMATSIAEIPNQVQGPQGEMAGILIPLKDGRTDVTIMTEKMLEVVSEETIYCELLKNVSVVAAKFDLPQIVEEHYAIYNKVLGRRA